MAARRQSGNPQAVSYLQAAGDAAQAGSYSKGMKLLKKYVDKRKTELRRPTKRRENPGLLAAVAQSAVVSGALHLAKKAFNPRIKNYDSSSLESTIAAAKKVAARDSRPYNVVITAYGWRVTKLSPAYNQPAFKVSPDGTVLDIRTGWKPGTKNPSVEKQKQIARDKEAYQKWMTPSATEKAKLDKEWEAIQKGKKHRNPAGDAAQEYEDFHGREPAEVIDLQEELMRSGCYWAVGDNPELWLRPVKGDPNKWGDPDIWFDPKEGVKLAANKKGTQLFFVGGDQKLSLDELKEAGHDTSKRFITLGTAYGVSYETEKVFDGYQHKSYAHQLGEETGEVPVAIYDKETERVILAGGAYHIPGVDTDLGASPGIVN